MVLGTRTLAADPSGPADEMGPLWIRLVVSYSTDVSSDCDLGCRLCRVAGHVVLLLPSGSVFAVEECAWSAVMFHSVAGHSDEQQHKCFPAQHCSHFVKGVSMCPLTK